MINSLQSVLLIEDSTIDMFIHTKVLEQSGIADEIVCQPSARDALEYLKEASHHGFLPQLIFLDIRMPDMNGFEFLNECADLPNDIAQKMKVIMLSSSIDSSDIHMAKSYPQVIDFISKPLTKERVLEVMMQFFSS